MNENYLIRIIVEENEVCTARLSDMYIIPSNLHGKKDLYVYDCVGKYVGYVSTKLKDNVTLDRDSLRNKFIEFIEGQTQYYSVSAKCTFERKGSSDKVIIAKLDEHNICSIERTSVYKSKNIPMSYITTHFSANRINKENKKINGVMSMKNNMFNFNNIFGGEIGKVTTDEVKLGINGEIAVKKPNGDYVSFTKDGSLMNVSNFAFDLGGLFILPVTVNNVKKGDIIIKDDVYYHVDTDGTETEGLKATSITTAEIKIFRPTKSMLLNAEYVRKVVSPFSMFGGTENNLLPLMLLSDNLGEDNNDMVKTLLMAQMMNNGSNGMNNLLPLLLMSKGSDNSFLPMMLMMNGGNLGNMFNFQQQSSLKTEDRQPQNDIPSTSK